MADNKEAFRDSSTQDDSLGTFVTIQTTWSGDTADAAGCFVGIASGSEGSWQFTPQVGGAGAVTAGTQRMTLASDDPAVVSLQLLDNALSGNAFSVVNAGTFAVQSSQAGNWNITNISGTITLPTGAATDTKQDTGNTSLASIDTKTPALGQALAAASVPIVLTAAQLSTLTPPAAITGFATEATLASILTSTQLLDNAVSGNEFQVDVLTVPANQTVNVNLLAGNAPNFGAGAAGTGTLRVFHASDDPAVVALQLLDNAVSGNSFAVTNAGTFAVQVDGAALTSLQLLDDVVFSVGEAHTLFSKGFVVSGRDNANSAAYPIPLHNGTHVLVTGASGGLFPVTGNAAHDAVASGNPVLIAGYASAAAPTDVSGDADAVQAWFLRNGAQATVITAGGALIPGSATDGLLVNLGSNNDVTVTGSVTANAGTNLNTSALALETGGNLAACATSLAALDNAVAGNELQVDVLTAPANQTININLVAGNSASAGTGNVAAGTLRVTQGSAATATLSSVNDTAASASLLASNTARKGVIIHNESTSILFIKYGATASATSYTVAVAANTTWTMPAPIYSGALDGIWSADSTGAARITELT